MGQNTSKKRADVDPQYLKPSGLYAASQCALRINFSRYFFAPLITTHPLCCTGDERVLRRMILERRLAPFYRGEEEPADDDREECPICMLYFPGGLNRSACCQQGLCSECFLQICPRANKPVRCGLPPRAIP